jgi:hypothetical protein
VTQRIIDEAARPRSCATCSRRSGRTRRRSASTSTASRRRRSACASIRSSRPSRRSWAAPTSTTSTASGAVPRVRAGRGRSAHEPRGREAAVGALGARRDDPLSTLLSLERISGPRDIPHYNVYRAAKIQGEAAPGYSSGRRSTRWRRSRATCCRVDVVRVDRHRLSGAPGRQPGARDPRALAGRGVPVPRRAVRELEPAVRDPARGAARVRRAPRRAGAARATPTTSTARSGS